MRFKSLGVLILVSACGVTPATQRPEVLSARIASEPEATLCDAYAKPTTTTRGKLMIEAELAVRGVKQCSGANYGASSAAAFGSTLYSRPASAPLSETADLRNCSDFSSGASAQKYFLAAGGPINDPNNLDTDGDGLACEWGSQIKRISSYRTPVVAKVRRNVPKALSTVPGSSGARCYTGPRGGRYTIAANGRKNYDGC